MKKHKKVKPIPFALPMILHCKGGSHKDKRQGRGGSKNKQREYLEESK